MSELRRDYFKGRWTIIAEDRKNRPNDFKGNVKCPFCPGSEKMTPPSVASYFAMGDAMIVRPDLEEIRHAGWSARVIPNMFPAVTPGDAVEYDEKRMHASGIHEVIIESPSHEAHPQRMTDGEARLLFDVYRDRFALASKLPYVKYVSMFRNYGKDAGASLSHPHSQMVALPVVPPVIMSQYGRDYGDIIKEEEDSPRHVLSTAHSVSFAPYASEYPYEVWVFPRMPRRNIAELSDAERHDMALAVRDILKKISGLLGDPAYNYCFIQSPRDDVRMHLKIKPRLGIIAGFELNTDIHVNSVPPETAASRLRNA